MSGHTPVPWEVRPMVGIHSGKVTGYTVERIHSPYTQEARAEVLRVDGVNIWKSEKEAYAAIAKATGDAA
jgi:hypothetical protein